MLKKCLCNTGEGCWQEAKAFLVLTAFPSFVECQPGVGSLRAQYIRSFLNNRKLFLCLLERWWVDEKSLNSVTRLGYPVRIWFLVVVTALGMTCN